MLHRGVSRCLEPMRSNRAGRSGAEQALDARVVAEVTVLAGGRDGVEDDLEGVGDGVGEEWSIGDRVMPYLLGFTEYFIGVGGPGGGLLVVW